MPELGEPLSQRELEVLQCVVDGASNKEIAAALVISQNTVKVHLRNIYSKLGASSRTEAATAGIQQGLIVISMEETAPPLEPQPDPARARETDASSDGETATAVPAAGHLNRRNVLLLLVLLATVVTLGLLARQTLNGAPTPTPELFEAIRLGDSSWFENKPLPEGRANMATAAVGLDIYQIGGETSEGVVSAVQVYDTVMHRWREAAGKPTAVADATAAVLFGEIYVPGGRLTNGQPTDIVEAYSPTNDAWRSVTALPQPVSGGLALSDGSFLYLFGGWDGERYLDTTYVYDVAADSWRPLTPMAQARAFAAGSTVTGRLYVVGGYDGQQELTLCQYLDVTTSQWADCPDMLLPRAGAGAAAVLNKLYVIGGGLGDDSEITFSEVYDPNSETWQVVNTPMMAGNPTWANLGVANVEVRIYALGGRRDQGLSSDNYTYAPRVFQTFIPAATSGEDN